MQQQSDGTSVPNPDDFRRGQADLIDLNDPQQSYKAMRERCPVVVSGGIAYISRHDDVDAGLRDAALFKSAGRASVGNARPVIPIDIDPPEHAMYRRILDPLFAQREMAQFVPDFTALTNQLIDGFIDRGSCDFATEFAVPLPSLMFLELFGLPSEDLPLLLKLNDAVMRPPAEGDVAAHMAQSGQRIYDYFEMHLAQRGDRRGADVISRLLDAEVEGRRLTHEEVLDVCYMLFLAGLDTVTASLECFIAYLAAHPEQRRRLSAEPEVIPSAVEELLRWESPVVIALKAAARDVTLRGCTIAADTPVVFLVGAANTDEHAYPNPELVDFEREPNRHYAFGKGIHRCLGSHLARIELRVALEELHRRIPDYEIAGGAELAWRGPAIRSVPSMPLTFPVGGRTSA